MRNSRLAHAIAGSRASDTPGRAPLCPQRRPPRPRHPIVGVIRRGGLRFGRHAAPNRDHTVPNRDLAAPNLDLTASKRGELHHKRRDTPATRRGEASNAAKPPPLPEQSQVAAPTSARTRPRHPLTRSWGAIHGPAMQYSQERGTHRHLKHRLSRINKLKSHPSSNMQCSIT